MSWYQPLLDALWNHMLNEHKDISESDNATEYRFTEEYIHYETYRHGEPYHFPCPWADCKWHRTYSVNFDLMTKVEEE
ncbi:unnamed protein product [marine sediment metagenome]|uniref:Uncharacterized protein n=1 Tax=marine sediment metagenome TaxID=412755 RepID=X1SQL3_9ZZZZ